MELQHETQFQRQVTYEGKTRLLSGYADYNPATNLIIIEVKKINSVDTCLDPSTAYMGVVHAYKKEEQKEDSVIYGAASDDLSFRLCRIDNESN